MPRGTEYTLTGILRLQRNEPVLKVDDGGEWRLDLAGRFEHLLGMRVTVEGTRGGFDLLYVRKIEAKDQR